MMDIKENYSLKKHNSFNIDVIAKEFIQINSVKEPVSYTHLTLPTKA